MISYLHFTTIVCKIKKTTNQNFKKRKKYLTEKWPSEHALKITDPNIDN